MIKEDCLFCDWKNPKKNVLITHNDYCFARWDLFPVSPGHAEIVPKEHRVSIHDLLSGEVLGIYDLAMRTIEIIEKTDFIELYHKLYYHGPIRREEYIFIRSHPSIDKKPDGYNIGFNEGEAAGRSIHHFHLHIIPRYKGDVPNPKGGIRNVIPGKGNY